MRDFILRDGRRVLTIETVDIIGRGLEYLNTIRNIFESSRARYDVVVVLVSPSLGPGALPQWMRGPPLKAVKGQISGGAWVMEKDEFGGWA